MKPAAKTYMWQLGGAMAAYAGTIFGVNSFLSGTELPQYQAAILALLPILPMLLAVRAVLNFSRSWDELERQQALEGALIAFLIVGMGTFSYGFLEGVGFPPLETIWVFPILIFSQGLGRFFVMRKYR